MSQPVTRWRRADLLLLVAALILLMLVSPLRQLWLGPAAPWYAAYLAWALVIGLIFWLARRGKRGEP